MAALVSRCAPSAAPPLALAATTFKQPGFSEAVVFSGLTNPTAVRFLPDGRVIVAEKSGLIKLFPNLSTNTYTVVADLRTEVHNFWDRGLLGLAVDPNFATNNFIYVLVHVRRADRRHGADLGTRRRHLRPLPDAAWRHDRRLRRQRAGSSRLTAVGADWTRERAGPDRTTGASSSRATRSARSTFGADGYLYVSGGDGASFGNADWGQFGGTLGAPARDSEEPLRRSARRRRRRS